MLQAVTSTCNKPNKGSSIPTRQQPKRTCTGKTRGSVDTDPSSLNPPERTRTDSKATTKQAEMNAGRPKRNIPPKRIPPKDASSSKRQPGSTRSRRKRPAPQKDIGDDESRPEDTKPTKRRRLDQSVTKTSLPTPEHKSPPWHLLPLELLQVIYDCLWDIPTTWRSFRDIKTLQSCALTCSRWRDGARPYIFRSITLKSPEILDKFSQQIHATPEITQWVRKLRLEGEVLPPPPDEPQVVDIEFYHGIDHWLYAFPAVLGVHLPCLRTLEFFNFKQFSALPEDQEAFAQWIPKLTKLESVTTLNLIGGQMSANDLTVLVRALPSLTQIDITAITLNLPNLGVLHEISTNFDSDDKPRSSAPEEAPGTVDKGTKYPIFYPPPMLQSLRIEHPYSGDGPFDLTVLRGWFCAESAAGQLRSLELAGPIDSESLHNLIYALGECPNLSHIQVSGDVLSSPVDLSRLTNLTSIHLADWECRQEQDESINPVWRILDQLNAPKLRVVGIGLRIEKEEDIAMLAPMDQLFANAKFNKLEVVQIELITTAPRKIDWGKSYEEVMRQIPSTAARGIVMTDVIEIRIDHSTNAALLNSTGVP